MPDSDLIKRRDFLRRKDAGQPSADEERSRPSRDWQRLIDEQIEQLDLDKLDLPGKGKPLDLSPNPYADAAQETAHRLIRNAGYTLPWIEASQQIDRALLAARQALLAAWQHYATLRDEQICAGHQWVEGEWQAALRRFREQVAEVNRQIRDYNLKTPLPALQKFAVLVDEELARLGIDTEA